MYLEKRALDYHIEIANSSGSAYAFQDLILAVFGEFAYFGDVPNKDGIANGARGNIDATPFRTIETDQLDTGTFAIDAPVYSEPGKDLLLETKTASTWQVGHVTRAKGSGTSIEMRTIIPVLATT